MPQGCGWLCAAASCRKLHASRKLSSTTFFFFSCRCEAHWNSNPWQNHPVLRAAFFEAVKMFPRVILKGTMIKKSQQKKRTSPSNYKERFFVLDTQDLKYSERRPGVSPRLTSFSHWHQGGLVWKCSILNASRDFNGLHQTMYAAHNAESNVLSEKTHAERLHRTVQD